MMKYASKDVRDSLGKVGVKSLSKIKEMNEERYR
jgi:hypothetical protein